MNELHVVFGATGALGQALTLRLLAEQVPVRAVVRNVDIARDILPDGLDIVAADATDIASVQAACQGAAVIYNAVYVTTDKWMVLTENFLTAARDTGARLVFPTNIHPYGPLQKVPATEDHPLSATNERGKLRIRMENYILDAHKKGDANVVLPRLAAFYGPTIRDGFIEVIFDSALANKKSFWYGSLDMPYDLIYTDDAATACFLLGTSAGAGGQVWHVPGAGPLTGREFITQVYEIAGKTPDLGVRDRNSFRVLSLVYRPARSLLEVLYEFEHPLEMDGSKFVNAFPDFSYTPHEQAIRETLDWFRQK